ncbi:ring finger domain-containing protein [Zymoseptoria brevis]|uniref:Ring finger domain-containing protein n=1 Tax=Zymoseptoria brevis TaxID=1047168 RepID=A0A0F4GVF1_9PEZI|nr:ring finger domain-containing protein [Zymoseptoria brevis]
MAAYSTGASWSFPDEIPGTWAPDGINSQRSSSNSTTEGSYHQKQEEETEPAAEAEPQPKRTRTHYPPRQCRICLEVVQPTLHYDTTPLPASMQSLPRVSYESEDGGRLMSPCKCKGSQKYVHEECLGAWRRADPLQTRNYWECPTCRYRYRLQRLTWSSWITSPLTQIGLTLSIFLISIFILGFVADPIINMYLDPVTTIATAGGPTGSLIYEDEPTSWFEHWIKGLASLGLLGFAKFLLTLSPFQWFNIRTGGGLGRSAVRGTGRDRLQQLGWITIIVGICTFLFAVWKGVRAWSRKTLAHAGERVIDVPGQDDDEDD